MKIAVYLYPFYLIFFPNFHRANGSDYQQSVEYDRFIQPLATAVNQQPSRGVYLSFTEFLEETEIQDEDVIQPRPNMTDFSFQAAGPTPPSILIQTLPTFFRENYGKKWVFEDDPTRGANCWNTALAFNDPEFPIRYTSQVELFGTLLEEYELVDPPLQRGDVVTVLSFVKGDKSIPWQYAKVDRWELNHSAVYLSGSWFFGKQTNMPMSPYEITSFGVQFVDYDTHLRHHISTDLTQGWRGRAPTYNVYTVHRRKTQ